MNRTSWVSRTLLLLGVALSACGPSTTSPRSTVTAAPQATSMVTETASPSASLRPLISEESLFSCLNGLTAIQPYSGWRGSATAGEGEGLDYVAGMLGGLAYLQDLGMELEKQSFHVLLATELWENRLYLTARGEETEVPASATRGHRQDVAKALRFDSDGGLNDTARDPVRAAGPILLIDSKADLDDLSPGEAQGRIAFLDSAVIGIDLQNRRATSEAAWEIVGALIDRGIAGLVVVTQFSATPMGIQGKLLGDGAAFEGVASEKVVPTLYVRLEDLAPAGISTWDDLATIESARLIWDADVFSPGSSGNLVARIPGADPSHAVILGAHIDSPNSPGAMDNGISSVALMEVARVLNESRTLPPVDLYLVWFGSEEIGLYGSQHFVNTHQDLLDRTAAVFVLDGITVSTPGSILFLDGWSYSSHGDNTLAYPESLAQAAAAQGIPIEAVEDRPGLSSDNSVFSGFVTQAGLAYGSEQGDYAHSPYDTIDLAQGLGDLMEQVTAVALIAALETDPDLPGLRVTPEPDRRAVLVASHTEAVQMSPAMLVALDRVLAWEGFDVDVIPYGQSVTSADLADADLAFALPVIDYPAPPGDGHAYDEAWTESEVESLIGYVDQGGLLVVSNTARRTWLGSLFEVNEDWPDANAIAGTFGVVFREGALSAASAPSQEGHALTANPWEMALLGGNAVPFTFQRGYTLAAVDDEPVAALVDYGAAGGQVLVLGDVGSLGYIGSVPADSNLALLRGLARYARSRAE